MWTAALLAVALVQAVPAQTPSPCDTPSHHAFDFWVGDWDVVNAAGRAAGASHVERLLDGCVIMEHWTGANGPYSGKSFNTFNPSDGQWTQHWVDTTGASIIMTGTFEGGRLVYHRELVRRDGTPAKSRMTFISLSPTQVRQLVEQSTDGGQTWTPQIDLLYKRRA